MRRRVSASVTAAAFASMYFNDPVCFGCLALCMRKMRETRGWLFLREVGLPQAAVLVPDYHGGGSYRHQRKGGAFAAG